ncbi:RHS repeat protein [Rubripirellula amarantea]|nr:RHS repeat protein [Rubripirellula amarantea]
MTCYPATNGLPLGLVHTETITTGRAIGDLVTHYEYIDSTTSGATTAQIGMLSKIIESPGTVDQAVTEFDYDARGNLIAVTDPVGRITQYRYDLLNRMVGMIEPDPDAAGPLLSAATRYDYDAFGNPVATETINSYIEDGVVSNNSTESSKRENTQL